MSTIIFSFWSSVWRMTWIVYIIQAFFTIVWTIIPVRTINTVPTIKLFETRITTRKNVIYYHIISLLVKQRINNDLKHPNHSHNTLTSKQNTQLSAKIG